VIVISSNCACLSSLVSRSDREGFLSCQSQEGLGPFHQSPEKEHRDVEEAMCGTYMLGRKCSDLVFSKEM